MPKYEIKKQFFINDTGHFKYLKNNTILINFVDKVKLTMDDYSMQMFLKDDLKKCFCLIYLTDSSQHELCLAEKNEINEFFAKYVSFLEQWLQWLINTETIKRETTSSQSSHVSQKPETLNYNTLQSHLSQLKLFNYTISQDSNDFETKTNNSSSNESFLSVSNLLRENSKFLQNMSK